MRGQISLEFILTMGLAVLLLVALLTIGANQLMHAVDEKADLALNDIALVIQQELVTAASVHDGYFRNFTLPTTIRNKPYNISSNGTASISVFTITTGNKQQSVRTPVCIGNLQPGPNTIRKQNFVLWCNQ